MKVEYTTEEFKEIGTLVRALPPKGGEYLQVLLLQKIFDEVKVDKDSIKNEILEEVRAESAIIIGEFLADLKNDTLKKICEDKKIEAKKLTKKEELTTAILG